MQPAVQDSNDMNTDDIEEQTQQATQSTDYSGSQSIGELELNRFLWGFLQPCSPLLRRIDFFKIQPTVTVGRHDLNDLILPGGKVSNRHCRLVWDGNETDKSAVLVADYSSNGTFINGVKIGKDKSAVLRDGSEIAFGTPFAQPESIEDYRFIFRHTATCQSQGGGIHAHYDFSHELGKGSFATVMKAISRSTGQWYAIKMIQENKIRRIGPTETKSEDEKPGHAFMREIAILEKLDHPNICRLKEVFMDRGNIDLVLEYVDGGDLLDFIVKNNGLDEPMAIHITSQLCDALAYIHDKGIAHRDLKPENVLLTSNEPPIVKVADFGLAKVVDSYTFLKTMCGTPSYLAPEVVMQTDQQGYSHLVDSWSVGVIVFAMLTSASPFIEDENQRDVKIRVASRTIDWNFLDSVDVSNTAKDFIHGLLEVDPARRLSLSAARYHPWLKKHGPAGPTNLTEMRDTNGSLASASFGGSFLSSVPEDDDSMAVISTNEPSVSSDLELLQLDQPGPSSHRMREHPPLQRLSQVQANIAENDSDLSDPSWHMLDTAGAGPARAGKRKLNEHDPQALSARETASRNRGGARKKGRQAEANDMEESTSSGSDNRPLAAAIPKRGGGTGRGRGRPAAEIRAQLQEAAYGMVIVEDHVEDGSSPPIEKPRRTSRAAPNKSRKA